MYLQSFRSGTAIKISNVGINAQNARYKALRFLKWGVNPFNVENGPNFLVRWSKFAKFLRNELPEVERSSRDWGNRGNWKRDWGWRWRTASEAGASLGQQCKASHHGEAPPDDVAQKWPGRHKVHGQVGHVGTWRTWMDRREGSSHVYMGTIKVWSVWLR